jgi:farnesyl-diphosphate farnesyltransferase
METRKTALQILEHTSRTFFIPIVKLPSQVQESVASAYLCLRAIDEV